MTTIGIFDSGIGGLSLVEACERSFAGVRILYVADTAHQPYGQKSARQVLEYSQGICNFFEEQTAQAILVACSTASAVALPTLQKSLALPVFGLLEGGWVDEALRRTRKGKIGILATTLTTTTGTFATELKKKAPPGVEILGQAAPDLIDRISEGRMEEEVLLPAIRCALRSLLEQGIDTLVIGCTHFNFILPQLQRIAGANVQIVNPRDWVVKCMGRCLGQIYLPPPLPPHPTLPRGGGGKRGKRGQGDEYYVTGDVQSFEKLARKLWRADAVFQPLEVAQAGIAK